MESQSWITDVYDEFWNKANELVNKESVSGETKLQRRDKHIEAMVSMFVSSMAAIQDIDSDDDCGDGEDRDCKNCDKLPECQEKWAKEARNN